MFFIISLEGGPLLVKYPRYDKMKNGRITSIFSIIGNSSIPVLPISTLFQQILPCLWFISKSALL